MARSRTRAWQTPRGRWWLTIAGVVAGAAFGGLVAALVLFPVKGGADPKLVERVYGLSVDEAQRTLEAAGFEMLLDGEEPDPGLSAGRILWQDPPAGTSMPGGGTVRVVASAGPPQVPVPDLIGYDLELGIRILTSAGFRTGATDSVAAPAETGVIVATRPGAGSGRPAGSTVDLVVSRGPATIRIPHLTGLTLREARERLLTAGLRVGTIQPRLTGEEAAVVIRSQSPGAGTLIPRDGTVNLVVARP